MTAQLIHFYRYHDRLRVPTGDMPKPAEIIILPVIHRQYATKPPRKPRTSPRRKTP